MENKLYTYKFMPKVYGKDINGKEVYNFELKDKKVLIHFHTEKGTIEERLIDDGYSGFLIGSEIKLTREEAYARIEGTVGFELVSGEFEGDTSPIIEMKQFKSLGFCTGSSLDQEESMELCKTYKLPLICSECQEYFKDGFRLYYWKEINILFITHYQHNELIAYFKPNNIKDIKYQLDTN